MAQKDTSQLNMKNEASNTQDLGITSRILPVSSETNEKSTSIEVTQDTPQDTKNGEETNKKNRKTQDIKEELSEYLDFNENDPRKRKRCDDEENCGEEVDVLLDVFLRSMYPLNDTIEKTITVGVFKSLNFKPAVLLSHCGKTSLVLLMEMWDKFTKYAPIIESYLFNNITGRKTAIGFENSDIEIETIRLRGFLYVKFRDLSKHNKKILLTFEEFQVLSNLIPAINRYSHQLATYGAIIFDYLNSSINTSPVIPVIYGPIDQAIYNRLPEEVSFYRRTTWLFKKISEEKQNTSSGQNTTDNSSKE